MEAPKPARIALITAMSVASSLATNATPIATPTQSARRKAWTARASSLHTVTSRIAAAARMGIIRPTRRRLSSGEIDHRALTRPQPSRATRAMTALELRRCWGGQPAKRASVAAAARMNVSGAVNGGAHLRQDARRCGAQAAAAAGDEGCFAVEFGLVRASLLRRQPDRSGAKRKRPGGPGVCWCVPCGS